MKKFIKVKEWFFDKTQETAGRYNTYIDVYSRDENGYIKADENGYITVKADDILNESEKAIQVLLSSGEMVGTCKGWKTWIPKSLIGGME